MRTVFFGTPEFAVPTLGALCAAGLTPDLVISQPDRPVGRGRKLQRPPVAEMAVGRGLQLRQPEKVREPALQGELRELAPDVAVVVAYGQIFRRSLLELPRHGCVNLHASLLPRWRGAAPIQAAIAAGDRSTGVTTMKMERGLDTGPTLLRSAVEIRPDETTPQLAERLANLGADLMVETLRGLEAGSLVAQPQDDERATLAPRLTREDAVADWRLPAKTLYDRWRAFQPWPGLSTTLGGQLLKIREVQLLERAEVVDGAPGSLLAPSEGIVPVRCGGASILGLVTVQRSGRRPVSAADLFHGERLKEGDHVG